MALQVVIPSTLPLLIFEQGIWVLVPPIYNVPGVVCDNIWVGTRCFWFGEPSSQILFILLIDSGVGISGSWDRIRHVDIVGRTSHDKDIHYSVYSHSC